MNTHGHHHHHHHTPSHAEKVLTQMSRHWGDRAQVKSVEYDLDLVYDEKRDDFLPDLIPLQGHPDYDEYFGDFRSKVLAGGWIIYNEKTIDIEARIVSPVCTDLIYKDIPCQDHELIRFAASETLVDESYHILMVVNAMMICKSKRGFNDMNLTGFSLTEKMNHEIAMAEHDWQKRIIRLGTSIVSEVFISDYLSLLSDDKTIQPINRLTTHAHKQDELAHSGLFKTFSKQIFAGFSEKQKRYFTEFLPKPINWFASREMNVWNQMLKQAGFPHADKIIAESREEHGDVDLSRIDYSELIGLADEIGLLDTAIGRESFIREGIMES